MSRKNVSDTFSAKPSRNDRFAQMSRQEQVIEQKKREIQARLQQQKEKGATVPAASTKQPSSSIDIKKSSRPLWKGTLGNKPNSNANNKQNSQFNIFSNDGSFLDQFKQINDTKKNFDQKITITSIKSDKVRDPHERSFSDDRNKPSRWSKSYIEPLNTYLEQEDLSAKTKVSRFSDLSPEPQPHTIATSYAPIFNSGDLFTNNFNIQPILVQTSTSILPPPPAIAVNATQLTTFSAATNTAPHLVPPQLSISVLPPQLIQQPGTVGALIAPPPPHAGIANQAIAGGINVPPPVLALPVAPPPGCSLELTSIPAPNPIPLHSIPQPEPINTLTIPPPAPLQLQNIPSPSPIRLNEIPKPKPIDLLNIPAPGDDPKLNKAITDPDFIKNVPPPNKAVPPPNLGTVTVTEFPNVAIPPPAANSAIISAPTSVPPPILPLHQNPQHLVQSANTQQLISVVTSTTIPSLMAQPVLPPLGMTPAGQLPSSTISSVNVNVSQQLVNIIPPVNMTSLPGPPPVLNQPPPIAQASQIPPMNFPPPIGPPPAVHLNASVPPVIDMNSGSASHDAMVSLGRMVAQCGPGIEEIVQQRSAQDPAMWFLFHKQSAAYQQYKQLVEQFKVELGAGNVNQAQNLFDVKPEYQPEDIYEPENVTDDEHQVDARNLSSEDKDSEMSDKSAEMSRKRKRKSRWGEKSSETTVVIQPRPACGPAPMISKITRSDPGLVQYAINTFGSANLSEEEWKKAEDHYKINLLYQEMLRKREEVERLKRQGRNKYEYDSDEETDGGTWEHKLRMQEMEATQMWANELTRQAEGKHHIGDFLPPDELKKFMEKYSAAKEGRQPNLSDYKEFKLKEDNIGFKMLQKLGWQEGQGLGTEGTGIVEPVNKATLRDQNQGLGLQQPDGLGNTDDEYDAYRKRMMLAYRFRPNPLNNPRRPYY